ncbi:M48 family metallopeptidase [Oceanobacillus salinisoli]|uniref:M48 family metallopeptidase n=1 Tax=Oceanobacillus salinisoli TaxID=2678611 RepID=UPI0012E32D04|nr:M48 family metallopeptidase [Oceanobacillus salinisoli]
MNKRLIHGNENIYFVMCVITSLFIYFALIISLIGIPYLVIGLLIAFFMNGLFIANVRTNGVKITEQQFPKIAAKVKELSLAMELKTIPDVFMIQSGGLLNAFATKFFGRNFVVLYSDIVEIIEDGNDSELNFIIAHELAHIKRNHISKNALIFPARWVPFLGTAYSRACEFTCDRIATVYTGNSKSAINALMILASGKMLFNKVNVVDYLEQHKRERGFFIFLSDASSTHPPLPIRIKKIQHIREAPEYYGCTFADFQNENESTV